MTSAGRAAKLDEIAASLKLAFDDSEGFTEDDWDALDRLDAALKAKLDLTPSRAARITGISSRDAHRLLGWMATHQYAHTSGNGAWTHYHPGRAR